MTPRLAGLMDAAATYRDRPPRIHSAIERFTAMWIPSVLVGLSYWASS